MKKIAIVSILSLFLSFTFALVSSAIVITAEITPQEGWEKTVTLPTGEVILDLSGEWDVQVEYYGGYGGLPSHTMTAAITQAGTVFMGLRQTETPWWPKGTEAIKGNLTREYSKRFR